MIIHIIMPMAGEGSRFKDAGYDIPKPLIKLNDKELYKHALDSISFTKYQMDRISFKYTFIIRKEFDLIKESILKDYPNANIISVEKTTRGALETVMLAKNHIDNDDHVMIMDCDLKLNSRRIMNTIYYGLAHFDHPMAVGFYSKDPKYSYAKLGNAYSYEDFNTESYSFDIIETTEKNPISNCAMTGIYYMGNGKIFKDTASELINDFNNGKINYKEIYISLIYNYFIKNGITPEIILTDPYFDHLWSFGTPYDLENYNYDRNIWDA